MKVFRFVAVNPKYKHFEPEIVKDTHVGLDGEFSLCGIQCVGEDGYSPSDDFEGVLTCPQCLKVINRVKEILAFNV